MRKINRFTVLSLVSILIIFATGFTLEKTEAYGYTSLNKQVESYNTSSNSQSYGNI